MHGQQQQQQLQQHKQPPQRLLEIQQQMLRKVQQQAAMGKPLAIGAELMSNEGVHGVVMENNTIKVSFNPMYNRQG